MRPPISATLEVRFCRVSITSFRALSCCPTRVPWDERASLNFSASAGSIFGQIILLGLVLELDPKADADRRFCGLTEFIYTNTKQEQAGVAGCRLARRSRVRRG